MPDQPNKFYLTTPIYYVNARPHIGHAYTTIVADVLARRHRLLGEDTYFLTGTDEHGQKIERSAAAAGIPPQQFADGVSKTFSDLWHRMGITHDQFIRTTSPAHARGVQKLFTTLYKKGFIYLASYTGSYCVSDEAFIDAPVGTPCPDCGRLLEEVTEENFFFKLSEFQEKLIDIINSKQLLITPDTSRNEVLSFLRGDVQSPVREYWDPKLNNSSKEELEKMGFASAGVVTMGSLSWEQQEEAYLAAGPRVAKSQTGVYYVPGALKDLSISRSSFTWGIPVPPEIQAKEKTAQKHVIYVWLDALANYMTGLGYGAAGYGSDDDSLFQKFWPADLHLVGKEITRFHCIYWPAFLLAAELPLPKEITAHGWLLFDNSKMSKSKGNIVRTETILEAFGTLCPPPLSTNPNPVILSEASAQSALAQSKDPDALHAATTAGTFPTTEPTQTDRDLFAADVLRYYLLREIPFGQDGSFSFEALITRYNADLANGYGNLVSRTLKMIEKYSAGKHCGGNELVWQLVSGSAPPFAETIEKLQESIRISYATRQLTVAAEAIAIFISRVDEYISFHKPWKLADDAENADQLKDVLYTAAESIRIITALLYPILPYATAKVWKQLGFEKSIEQAAADGELSHLQWGGLKPNTKLGPLGPIFPRADKGLAQTMTNLEEQSAPGPQPNSPQPTAVQDTSSPAAPPRTSTLPEPALTVASSHAHTTGPDPTPAPLTTSHQPLTTEQITIDDFAKIELRVAAITLAERIPKADKLLRLEVDLGPYGQRQILSGIAEFYTPEELIGRRIVVITNLAPRKMRGLESHGMLLAASDGDHGKPHLATCGEDIPLGSRLK